MSHPTSDRIGLTLARPKLRALTGKEPPPFRTLYRKVLDGELTAYRVKNRWEVDIHQAAVELGLINNDAD